MCTNTFILVLIFIIKILVFLIPISIYVLKKLNLIEDLIKYFYIAEVLLLILLISLCLFGSNCIKNSFINKIKLNHTLFDNVKTIKEETINIDFKSINPSKVYKDFSNSNVNYYNINLYPVKNINMVCDKKEYFEHYGNDISALSTALSSTTKSTINPYNILKYLLETNSIDCDTRIGIDDMIYRVTDFYGVNVRQITSSGLIDSINQGKIVIGKTVVTDSENLACGEQLVVIYSMNDKGEFYILNPSDRSNDYFCSDNTKGYGTIVKGNQNSLTYDLTLLSEKISEFYVFEVR